MKTVTFLFGLAVQMSLTLHGQLATTPATSAELTTKSRPLGYLIGERGLNHRVWHKVVAETNQLGWVSYATNKAYVELHSGLHYRDAQGELQESKEVIEVLPTGGAAALQGQHKVYFPSDIYDGVIEIVTVDGRRLKSRPLGLSYFDGTNNVLASELTHSAGLILPSGNQVIYTNAFKGLSADLVVTYRKGGVESDVVFREQPPKPDEFKMDPERARLQLWTEFFDTAAPEQKEARTNGVDGLTDRTLKFGAMKMVQGRAFALTNNPTRSLTNNPATHDRVGETPVYKTWQQQDGRTFLIEELPYRRVRKELERLRPSATTNRLASAAKLTPMFELPPLRMAQASREATMQLAQADLLAEPGYVLDYTMVGSTTSLDLTAGTYYVAGDVYVDELTYASNVVVKYGRTGGYGGVGRLIVNSFSPDQSYLDEYYNRSNPEPIIFTSMDDDSVGEIISGSSGSPYAEAGTGMVGNSDFSYGGRCRYLGAALNPGYNLYLTGWSFEHCQVAIYYGGSDNRYIAAYDSQFSNCEVCVYHDGSGSAVWFYPDNTSFSNCDNVYCGNAGADVENSFSTSIAPFSAAANDDLVVELSSYSLSRINIAWNGNGPNLYWGDLEYGYPGTYMGGIPGNGWLHASASTFGVGGQTVGSLTFTYTNGYFAWSGLCGINPDSDADGLMDAWEQQHFGNLNQTATGDYDGDGLSNLAEYNTGTNPAQFSNVRLSYWNFDPHSPSYLYGDRGQSPLTAALPVNVAGVSTNAVSLTNTTAGILKYRIGETTGCTNILPRQGTVAFWYKPAWDSTSAGGTGPGVDGRLIEMGIKNTGLGWWALLVDAEGDNLYFATHGNNPHLSAEIQWAADTWHQIVFTYSETATCLYVDGQAVAWGQGVDVIYNVWGLYNNGFFLGSDYYGNNRAKGTFDELKICNYPIDYADAMAAMDTDSDLLPDAWEFNHFGNLAQDGAGDYDNDGRINLLECTEGTNPNTIAFIVSFDSTYTTQTSPAGSAEVRGGQPSRVAVLVDPDPDPDTLTPSQIPWEDCPAGTQVGSQLALAPNIGPSDGWHRVWVGMSGSASGSLPTWNSVRLKLDRQSPEVNITTPATLVATVPYRLVQIIGYASEKIGKVTYDLTSSELSLTGVPAFVTEEMEDRSDFQAFDVNLTPGEANTLILHVWDRSGNETTTSLTLTVNENTEPPGNAGVIWPADGTLIASDNCTVVGQVADPGSSVVATIAVEGEVKTIFGRVDRNGCYFIEDVPVPAGENTLNVTVTDSVGRSAPTACEIQRAPYTVGAWVGDLQRLETTFGGSVEKDVGTLPDIRSVTINGDQTTILNGEQSWQNVVLPLAPDKSMFRVHVVLTPESGQQIEWNKVYVKPALVRIGMYSETDDVGGSIENYGSYHTTYHLASWHDNTIAASRETHEWGTPYGSFNQWADYSFPRDRFLVSDGWPNNRAGGQVTTPSKPISYEVNLPNPEFRLPAPLVVAAYRDIDLDLSPEDPDQAQWYRQQSDFTLVIETGGRPGEWIPLQLDLGLSTVEGDAYSVSPQNNDPNAYPRPYPVSPGGINLVPLGKTDPNGRLWLMAPACSQIALKAELKNLDRIKPMHPRIDEKFEYGAAIVMESRTFDVAIDSNNNGVIEPVGDDDAVEDQAPGQIIVVNAANDDHDGIPNWADFEIANPSDPAQSFGTLRTLKIRVPGTQGNILRLRFDYAASDPSAINFEANPLAPPGEGKMRLWQVPASATTRLKQAAPAGEYIEPNHAYSLADLGYPGPYEDEPFEIELKMEMVCASAAPGDISVKVEMDPDGDGPLGYCQYDKVRMTAVKVASVQWVELESPLDANPKPGGGKRVFPDWRTQDEGNGANPPDRKKVEIRATVTPPMSGVVVYFKVIDVDDPSSSLAPIDDEASSTDNRGALTQVSSMGIGSVNGMATASFSVSQNAGDNYRAVAALRSDTFENMRAKQDDGIQAGILNGDIPVPSIQISELLTVWRRLNVEIDTMRAPTEADGPFGVVSGTSASTTANSLTAQSSPGWSANKLEGGVLKPNAGDPGASLVHGTTWEVIGNTGGEVTVKADYTDDTFDNDGMNGPDDAGESYSMTPANPSNLPFKVDTDDPEWLTEALPRPGDTETINELNGYYNAAYIQCVLAEGNEHPEFDFVRNGIDRHDNTVDVLHSANFWSVAIAWCYENEARVQGTPCPTHQRNSYLGDDDPENEGLPQGPGNRTTTLGIAGEEKRAVDIYTESIRDRGGQTVMVVAHEIGHEFGLDHAPYAWPGRTDDFLEGDRGIMGWYPGTTYLCPHDWWALDPLSHMYPRFSNNNIHKLRSQTQTNP